jgi:MYXO-CTERM domain-containing protein
MARQAWVIVIRALTLWLLCLGAPRPALAIGSFELLGPSGGAWVSSMPTFRWDSAGTVASYTLTISPSTGAPLSKTGLVATSYALPAAEALSEAGNPFSWHVTAYDAAGTSVDSKTRSFSVDTTPPRDFSITKPSANEWSRTPFAGVSWTVAGDSGSGVSKYRVYVDGKLCQEVPGSVASANLFGHSCENISDGIHYWSVAAVDALGNVKWCDEAPNGEGGRPFRLDNTGPGDGTAGGVFSLASSNDPANHNAGDNMLDTGLNVNKGDRIQISASGTWCFTDCATGCYGVDGLWSSVAGAPAPECNRYSLLARIGPPGFVRPGTGEPYFACVGGGSTFTAETGGVLYLGGNADINLGYCNDRTVTATVTGGRTVGLIEPLDGALVTDPLPTFSWKPATDQGIGGVYYRLAIDDDVVEDAIQGTSIRLTKPLAEGRHTWGVAALDALDNGTASVDRTLWVGVKRPMDFSLDSPEDGSCTTEPTPSLCWFRRPHETEIAEYQLWIDGAQVATTTARCATPPAALAQGTHTWYVVAVDLAGNTRQSSNTGKLRVDYTAPSAPTLLAPADSSSTIDPPTFTWSPAHDDVGIASYEIYLDGYSRSTVSSTTSSWRLTDELSLGAHSWYVVANDFCGQATPSATWTITANPCQVDGAAHPCAGHSLGVCTPGTRTCKAPGTWSACTGAVTPAPEICNGLDDNCDGVVDEAVGHTGNDCGGVCPLEHALYVACDGPDADKCAEGEWRCAGLNHVECVESTPARVEICNGWDDDCNGTVDDPPVCNNPPPDAASPGKDAAVDASKDVGQASFMEAGVAQPEAADGGLVNARDGGPLADSTPTVYDAGQDWAVAADTVARLTDGPPNLPSDGGTIQTGDAPLDDGSRNGNDLGIADGAGSASAQGQGCSCRIGKQGPSRQSLPWLLAIAFALLLRRLRRA